MRLCKNHSGIANFKLFDEFWFDVEYEYYFKEGIMYDIAGDPGYPDEERLEINSVSTNANLLDIFDELQPLINKRVNAGFNFTIQDILLELLYNELVEYLKNYD